VSTDQLLAVLGLTRGASPDDIKEAFRDLAQVWHPDRFGHDPRLRAKAEEKFKQINAAYQELTTAARRAVPSSSAAVVSHAGTGHQSRFVRMSLPGVEVRFAGRRARLISLSISGGQLLLEYLPELNSQSSLRLDAENDRLELEARVVRVSPPSPNAGPEFGRPTALVSIKFVDLSIKQQRAIPRFYNLLLAYATEQAAR
jgi:curved DNA-binding protein CbpA